MDLYSSGSLAAGNAGWPMQVPYNELRRSHQLLTLTRGSLQHRFPLYAQRCNAQPDIKDCATRRSLRLSHCGATNDGRAHANMNTPLMVVTFAGAI